MFTMMIDGKEVGICEGFEYHIVREQAPIYTLPQPGPRFTRGKRSLTLIFRKISTKIENHNKPIDHLDVIRESREYDEIFTFGIVEFTEHHDNHSVAIARRVYATHICPKQNRYASRSMMMHY